MDLLPQAAAAYLGCNAGPTCLPPPIRMLSLSAGDLGNLDGRSKSTNYTGVALTLIDAMSTLAVMGQAVDFEAGLWWLVDNVRAEHGVVGTREHQAGQQ